MKKQTVAKILSALLAACMLCLAACSTAAEIPNDNSSLDAGIGSITPEQGGNASVTPSDTSNNVKDDANENAENIPADKLLQHAPEGSYNKGIVLVKSKGEIDQSILSSIDATSAEPIYTGSSWYSIKLKDENKTVEAATYLFELGCFEQVDYDYVMDTTDSGEAQVTDNPHYKDQANLGLHNIPQGWTHNGKHPGGSSDVVVAVIDTGVDYNHLDLRNNIWINAAEIPDNNKDDDGNGYVDDVYGWDCVGNDKDPMDDNGHGTHVAGIIAAENNKIGGIGVAYGCKVMVLKAGNSSGYFNNSDIAEAVRYAYMNGASVINMSFGGSFISIAVEEALQNAYTSCILVAAAGNDGACNNLSCSKCEFLSVSYPAALPYVIGVMSTDGSGAHVSGFSNYDHYPYDSIEYEVYAVGEAVPSTWPGNKYAYLNGTSMAAPTVSGIAALLRSTYTDRNMYSTKFIQSQIVNTGTVYPTNLTIQKQDSAHSVANVYEAMTRIPKPAVNLYEYSIDDSVSISEKNNGNGIIDAGETVRLYVSLHNRGGVASNVNVSVDTIRSAGIVDPYFTFTISELQYSDIGTYSVRDPDQETYFEIVVSQDCPNDYLVDFNIHFTYENGLDDQDTTVYTDDGRQKAQFNVSSGYHLPSIINEDTVFTNDRLYIVGENITITAGITVTFEEGCHIQFYDDRSYYNSPVITVYGTLNIAGTKENMVTLAPNERNASFAGKINVEKGGAAYLNYADCVNVLLNDLNYNQTYSQNTSCSSISNSRLINETGNSGYPYIYQEGRTDSFAQYVYVGSITDSYINMGYAYLRAGTFDSNYIVMDLYNCEIYPQANYRYVNGGSCGEGKFTNNIVYTSYNRKSPNYSSSRELNCSYCSQVSNNIFVSSDDTNIRTFLKIENYNSQYTTFENNQFAAYFDAYADQIIDGYFDENGMPTLDIYSSIGDASALYPYILSVEIFNADGELINTIGKEEIKVRVTFNKAMDTSVNPGVFFGSILPYADYKIEGDYVSDTVWEGTYSLKAYIENGRQQMLVKGACAAGDATKVVHGEDQLYEFHIDTTAAMSMSLIANATDTGIELTWTQDDYDTLMGYNIYRATSKDGNYVKINPSVLLASESSFVDDNAEPGVTYWYTFTVVLSDFSESAPAGKVYCTAVDTLNPTVYHTPVNQGYQNNNLVISCTASDNMKIASVTLYYRTAGQTEYKSLAMSKVNDKYSVTVFGSELTLDGLEYYIVASDGSNSVTKGSAQEPYFVVIKDASAISRIGDVDGDGVVTTKDALMIMQCINGDLIMTDDEFKRADLNGDEQLSSVEALRILQYINGNVSTLDM